MHFLLVHNMHPISHHFQVIACGSYYRSWQGCLSLTHVFGGNPWTTKFGARKLHTSHPSLVRYEMYFDILNRLGVDRQCDRRTDRQTDRMDGLWNDCWASCLILIQLAFVILIMRSMRVISLCFYVTFVFFYFSILCIITYNLSTVQAASVVFFFDPSVFTGSSVDCRRQCMLRGWIWPLPAVFDTFRHFLFAAQNCKTAVRIRNFRTSVGMYAVVTVADQGLSWGGFVCLLPKTRKLTKFSPLPATIIASEKFLCLWGGVRPNPTTSPWIRPWVSPRSDQYLTLTSDTESYFSIFRRHAANAVRASPYVSDRGCRVDPRCTQQTPSELMASRSNVWAPRWHSLIFIFAAAVFVVSASQGPRWYSCCWIIERARVGADHRYATSQQQVSTVSAP